MKRFCAIWDVQKAGAGLGSLLLFQEELLLYAKIMDAQEIELHVLIGGCNIPFSYFASLGQLNPFICALHLYKDKEKMMRQMEKTELFVWPSSDVKEPFSYNESTLHIQTLWRKTAALIDIKSPIPIREMAASWLKEMIPEGCFPVTVHLKNNKENKQSNANQDEWLIFFKDCFDGQLPVRFVLVGNDRYDDKFSLCPNCIVTRKNGGSLDLDLALIQESRLFMGMSSGPGNIAILSRMPYLIWKHPDHHSAEMGRELNDEDRFIFSNQMQRLIRDNDSFVNIKRHFSWLYKKIIKLRGNK